MATRRAVAAATIRLRPSSGSLTVGSSVERLDIGRERVRSEQLLEGLGHDPLHGRGHLRYPLAGDLRYDGVVDLEQEHSGIVPVEADHRPLGSLGHVALDALIERLVNGLVRAEHAHAAGREPDITLALGKLLVLVECVSELRKRSLPVTDPLADLVLRVLDPGELLNRLDQAPGADAVQDAQVAALADLPPLAPLVLLLGLL